MTGDDHDRFVSIGYFVRDMMGMKSRDWYYHHLNDPGFPQQVLVGGTKKLSLKACIAYQESIKRQARPAPPPKRRRGRPPKVRPPAAA